MAAARALAVGHVTVGRRIALFEKRLGVTLLNRTPEGFAVTSAGEAILRQCTAMETAALDTSAASLHFNKSQGGDATHSQCPSEGPFPSVSDKIAPLRQPSLGAFSTEAAGSAARPTSASLIGQALGGW